MGVSAIKVDFGEAAPYKVSIVMEKPVSSIIFDPLRYNKIVSDLTIKYIMKGSFGARST